MNFKKLVILTIGLCFALNFAKAQSPGKLTGQITDNRKQAISFAAIALHRLPDSVLMKTALADSAGNFIIEKPAGNHIVKISAIGYATRIISLNSDNETLLIELAEEANRVNAVTVTARQPMVVRKQDRTVVNVDAMLTAAGGTAMDALEKSPGVLVDQNGNISLQGKQGVMVFIDDKPTYLSGEELANYLRSLPSSTLSEIELMTNPPARYDAAGNAGIINIKIKRNSIRGFNGSLNLAATQGELTRANNSINLNYRNNNLSLFGTVSHNHNNSFTDLDLNRVYYTGTGAPLSYFEQNSYFDRQGNTLNGRVGADWYVTEKTTLGILLTGSTRRSKQLNDNVSNLYSGTRVLDSMIVAVNDDRIDFRNTGLNLNYRTSFDKNGHGLTADADLISYRNTTTQDYRNFSYLPDNTLKFSDRLDGTLPNNIDIYTAKIDYMKPLAAWRFSAGLKTSHTRTNNIAGYTYTTAGVTRPDFDKSNHSIYKENIHAGYINLSTEGKKLSMQGGLRLEQTRSNGHQLGNPVRTDSVFSRVYTNLFPTVFASYKFDSLARHQIGVNYGRRIDRPFYQDLNPFYYPMDKFTYYSGNPFLQPSFVQTVELSYTFKNKITLSADYSRAKDEVGETIEIANGIYYSRPGNLGRKTIKSLNLSGGVDPAKWLSIQFYAGFGNIATNSAFYTGRLVTSGNYHVLNVTNRLTFGKGWDGEISGNYRSKLTEAQFIMQDIWGINLGLQKKISQSWTARLTASDLFLTRVNVGQITNLAGADANWVNRNDSRNFTLSFSYRFGKAFNTRTKHDASGADAEKNRVKN